MLSPAAILTNDHAAIDTVLAHLRAACEGDDARASYAAVDLFWARLAVHIRAEHLHLFHTVLTAIKNQKLAEPSLAEAESIIAQLRSDHDYYMHELASAVATARELVSTTDQLQIRAGLIHISKILTAVTSSLQRHNQIEEQTIYRWVGIFLDSQMRVKLASQIEQELSNRPPRFSNNIWHGFAQ